MPYPIKDCDCEDFPCCVHADNFGDEGPPYCDQCGFNHFGDCFEDDEDLDEDEQVVRRTIRKGPTLGELMYDQG
jgi:hypothetical protein